MINFETKSGNEYVYCSESGVIYPKKVYNRRFNAIKEFEKNLINERKKNYTEKNTSEELRTNVLRYGLQELLLEVTQNCNLQCRYCIYSEVYPMYRNNTLRAMNEDIAIKAIDLYFSLLREGISYNPYREPTIGFYGGEPLLNFELIKKCIKYVKIKYKEFNPHFTITTNGTLLSSKIASFLVQSNCSLIVSLDGPKEEHDRNRIFPNGKGSYDIIMKRLNNLKKFYPDLPVFSIAVYDWKTDFDKVNEFFARKDVPSLIKANLVDARGTYYEQFNKEDFDTFKEKIKKMEYYNAEVLSTNEKNNLSLYSHYFSGQVVETYGRYIGKYRNNYIPYTGACMPGFKMFVDCDGIIHVCEKVAGELSVIGEVKNGLDYSKIEKIIKRFRAATFFCESCDIENLCTMCYVFFIKGDKMEHPHHICENMKKEMLSLFPYLWTIAEKDNKVFSHISDNFFNLESKIGRELL
jgi:uncharacterized protein